MKSLLISAVALSTIALGATAVLAQQPGPSSQPPAADSGQTCLQVNRMYSWELVNESTLMVKDSLKHRYRVALNGDCAYSNFYDKIIFRPLTQSTMGCVGVGDHVNLSDRMGQVERCYVKAITPYTDAQLRIDQQNTQIRSKTK